MMLWKQLADRLKAGMHGAHTPFSRSHLLAHRKPVQPKHGEEVKSNKKTKERSAQPQIGELVKPTGHHSF